MKTPNATPCPFAERRLPMIGLTTVVSLVALEVGHVGEGLCSPPQPAKTTIIHLEAKWNLLSVVLPEGLQPPEGVWVRPSSSHVADADAWIYAPQRVGSEAARTSTSSGAHSFRHAGVWVYAQTPTDWTLPTRALTPGVDPAADATDWRFLGTREPVRRAQSDAQRVVEWNARLEQFRTLGPDETLVPGHGYWVFKGGGPSTHLGTPKKVVVGDTPSVWATEPGEFERPFSPHATHKEGALVNLAIAHHEGFTFAHLVYVVPGTQKQGDRLHYVKSHKAGKKGSWGRPTPLAVLPPNAMVVDVALAACDAKVAVAWTTQNAQEGTSTVSIVENTEGGRWPQRPRIHVLKRGTEWKKGLDAAYDRWGHHHLVWGESNKVHYAKDFVVETDASGDAHSVFDVRWRKAVTEELRSLVLYAPDAKSGVCPCDDCWCPESYPLSQEPDPKNAGAPIGPYMYGAIEAFVYEPSLSVDDTRIAVVAREARAWEDIPVPNPAWLRMASEPLYSPQVIVGDRLTRHVLGWRKTWKHAYEPEDEALWDSLGVNYQYRYRGRWRTHDAIKVALRPLVGEQPTPLEWKDDRASRWQISVIDEAPENSRGSKPSHPQLATGPSGRMVAVYEQGNQEGTHRSGTNPIHVAESQDGGLTWSRQGPIGWGYRPDVAVSSEGRTHIVYYEPNPSVQENGTPLGDIHLAREHNGRFTEIQRLNMHPSKPLQWGASDQAPPRLLSAPQLAVWEELIVAAWVRRGADDGHPPPGVVVSRTRDAHDERQLSVRSARTQGSSGRTSEFEVVLEDKFHFRIQENRNIPIDREQQSSRSPWLPSTLPVFTDAQWPQSHGALALDKTPDGLPVLRLHQGVAHVAVAPETAAAQKNDPTAIAQSNYRRALEIRDALLFRTDSDEPSVRPRHHQVEYLPDPEHFPDDTTFLADAKRVWAYTQGIALAQRSRGPLAQDRAAAQGIARRLCDTAVRASGIHPPHERVIRGWPFSNNTYQDHFRDPRLVTGANAWVVHGLGAFLVSGAAFALEDPQERSDLKACYTLALEGLEEHRRNLEPGLSLMTAGWTVRGLFYASSPQKLDPRMPAFPKDPTEQWEYYDVLDALGYETFVDDDLKRPKIRTFRFQTQNGKPPQKVYGRVVSLSEADWEILREPMQAENVVTEHNLDMLAVLNQAIHHADLLGPDEAEQREAWVAHLRAWRDHLRTAIFELLWDDQPWKTDLSTEHAAPAGQAPGRIVTGGAFNTDRGPWQKENFVASPHSAIDNGSWLALFVNYSDLPEPMLDKLGRALEYTLLVFAKPLAFEGRTYYGTHYFKNNFKDPYIAENELQERSYHLEATLGLILGLDHFAQAHPEHPRSARFQTQAEALWTGVQQYVRDWGFPYSSQRIQDLSTRLLSSTAAIWFIDAYEVLNPTGPEPVAHTQEASAQGTEPRRIMPKGPAFLLAAQDPRFVQYNQLLSWLLSGGSKAAVGTAGTETLKGTLLGWLTGSATALGLSEHIGPLSELLAQGFGAAYPHRHNVVVVKKGVRFEIPDGFRHVTVPHSVSIRDLLGRSPQEHHLFAEELLAEEAAVYAQGALGYRKPSPQNPFGDRDAEWVRTLALALDSVWRGQIPQNIIVLETDDGLDFLHAFPSLERTSSPFAPYGLVLVLEPSAPVKVTYQSDGPWHDWMSLDPALTQGLSEDHRQAFLRYQFEWVLQMILGHQQPDDWRTRFEAIRAMVLGGPAPHGPNMAEPGMTSIPEGRTHEASVGPTWKDTTHPRVVSPPEEPASPPQFSEALPLDPTNPDSPIQIVADAKGAPAFEATDINIIQETSLTRVQINRYRTELKRALADVAYFGPPNQDHLFSWQGPRDVLAGKSFSLQLEENSSATAKLFFVGASDVPKGVLAFTTVKPAGEITLHLVTDRLFFDDHPLDADASARLVAALAHEIYGPVQDALLTPLDAIQSFRTPEEHVQRQTYAFEASTQFLQRIVTSEEYTTYDGEKQQAYQALLVQEQRGIDAWKAEFDRVLQQVTAVAGASDITDGFENDLDSGPVRISKIAMTDERLALVDEHLLNRRHAVLVYHPNHGYAVFGTYKTPNPILTPHAMWKTIESWGEATEVISVIGQDEPEWYDNDMVVEEVFKHTSQKYLRVLTGESVSFYNRDLEELPSMVDLSDPLRAYRNGVQAVEWYVRKHIQHDEPQKNLFAHNPVYIGSKPLSDRSLDHSTSKVLQGEAVVQLHVPGPSGPNSDRFVAFALDGQGGWSNAITQAAHFARVQVVGVSGTGIDKQSELKWLEAVWKGIKAHGINQPFVRAIRNGKVRYYNSALKVVRDGNPSDEPLNEHVLVTDHLLKGPLVPHFYLGPG